MTLDDFINDPDIVVAPPEAFTAVPERKKSKDNWYKPVVEYNIYGEFIASYKSQKEASEATGVSYSAIGNICTGRNLTSYKDGIHRIFLFRGDDVVKRLDKIDKKKEEYKSSHPQNASAKEVCEYTLGGRFLYKYSSGKEAAIVNKCSSYLVYNCCKGKKLYVGNRIFLYPEDSIKERTKLVKAELYRLSQKRPKYREVDEYSLDGTFIKAYPSASAASRECGIHVSDITRCCNGGDKYDRYRLTTKGRIFLWVGDSISDRLELIKQIKEEKKCKKS